MVDEKCLNCLRGFHQSCEIDDCNCSHDIKPETVQNAPTPPSQADHPNRYKRDAALKDQQSTGRKRAAKLYPLDRSAACEWQSNPTAGGGITIRGCETGKQQARHHGPDYNTLNNEPGNVHRICHSCHRKWHEANDPHKDESYLRIYGDRGKYLQTKKLR